jgi:ketosteroid isomerase-like protein
MRNVTIALVLFVAAGAQAQKGSKARAGGATAEAQKAIDKMDELYNAHDAKGMVAMLDKDVIGGGPYLGSKLENYESMKTMIEQATAAGGRIERQNVEVRAEPDGDTAWYIADYVMIPKVGPGMLPVRRPVRETGVLVRHGKEWKLASWGLAVLAQAPPPPATKTGAAPPPVPAQR